MSRFSFLRGRTDGRPDKAIVRSRKRHSRCVHSHFVGEALEAKLLLATFEVINSESSGPGSLAQAIIDVNATAALDNITFKLSANDAGHVYYRDDGITGQITVERRASTTAASDNDIADRDPDWPHSWFTIAPTAPLPAITQPVRIDGYSQPASRANTETVGQGLNTILRIELSGENAGDLPEALLKFTASGNTVRGLAMNRTQGFKLWLDSSSHGNTIGGNFFGPDISGTIEFPKPAQGAVSFFGGVASISGGNQIGGTAPADRNLISGNGGPRFQTDGIYSGGDNRIQGNLIGTDRSGTKAVPNERGVTTGSASGTLIGSPEAGAANVISGNRVGLQLNVSAVVRNNLIGTDVTGSISVGNVEGISLPSTLLKAQIVANTIAYNVVGINSFGGNNLFSQNLVFGNLQGPGIDNNPAGITLNDVPPETDPPDQDRAQNYPQLASLIETAGGSRVGGVLQSTPGGVFRLEFFAAAGRNETLGYLDPIKGERVLGGYGDAEFFLGTSDVTDGDGDGRVEFTVDLPPLPVGKKFVVATATNLTNTGSGPLNRTSELSPIIPVGGCSSVVVNTGDVGVGTLREAILCRMNDRARVAEPITFDIPADDPRHYYYRDDGIAGSVSRDLVATTSVADDAQLPSSGVNRVDPDWPHSWYSILPTRPLPEVMIGTAIDGYSQPGARRNTVPSPGGLDTVLKIELDGSNVRREGILISHSDVHSVQGLAINRFGSYGIRLSNAGGTFIAGNFIGTDVSGTVALANSLQGINMWNDSKMTQIGGTRPEWRNLIAGHLTSDIVSTSTGADVIQGNLIGTDRTGTQRLGSSLFGIFIGGVFAGSSLVWIGGIEPGAGNVIASGGSAIAIDVPAFQAPFQSGNLIEKLQSCDGVLNAARKLRDIYFTTRHPDDYDRVLFSASLFLFCATSFGQTDFIAQANPILGNTILPGGRQVSIDLGGDGATVNDPDDPATPEIDPDFDGGPNNLQNYPVLAAAMTDEAKTTIRGNLNSLPNTSFRVEYFSSSVSNVAGQGVGERWLGAQTVTTDGSGNAPLEFAPNERVASGRHVSATATLIFEFVDDQERVLIPLDTSEMSPAIPVTSDERKGDFDGNGVINASDIDLLAAAIRTGSNDIRFDLDESGILDPADHEFLVQNILRTSAGDANLDGRFESGDIVLVFRAGEYEDDVAGNSGWASGDWNGDGEFDTSDIVRAFQTGQYELAAALEAVFDLQRTSKQRSR